MIVWLVYALPKIWVARDAHLLRNDCTGKIASANWDSHESENIGTRPLYRILSMLYQARWLSPPSFLSREAEASPVPMTLHQPYIVTLLHVWT